MVPHGPDAKVFKNGTTRPLGPQKILINDRVTNITNIYIYIYVCSVNTKLNKYNGTEGHTLILFQSFMFETSLGLAVTKWGSKTSDKLDRDYYKGWIDLPKNFNPNNKPDEYMYL